MMQESVIPRSPDSWRRTLPRLVWCASAVICAVMLGDGAGRLEYIPMEPSTRQELAPFRSGEGPESLVISRASNRIAWPIVEGRPE